MNFDSPSSLWWFALAIPIVVFYILKIRLRRQPVSTVMFWKQVLDEQNPRSIWQRLRHFVSLLLQLALLSLLVLSVADPYFFWEIRSARRIVIVIDHSASMNATDVSPTRLAAAKQAADLLISGMRHRDEFALIAAGHQPQVVIGFTGRQRALSDAVQTLPPSDGPSNIGDAIALGQRLLGERQDGKQQEVVVYSDGCFAGVEQYQSGTPAATKAEPSNADPAVPVASQSVGDSEQPQTKLTLNVIGTQAGNVGITQFQVRRSLIDPLGYQILAEVTNASGQPMECRFEVDFTSFQSESSEPIDVVPLKLEPGAKWSQIFEKTSAAGGHLIARIKIDDILTVDNEARAVLPRREIQPVILVTAGNLFLQKVFEANPLVNLTVVSEPPEAIPAGTVVVYHRVTPTKLPAGNVFVIDPANSSDVFTIGEQLENAIVAKQDKDSPLMAHVRLDNVLMPEARKLTALQPDQAQVLAAAVSTDPLYMTINRPEGKVLVLTVDLDKGNLPLLTAFPISVGNALHWFAGNKSDLRESLATGSLTTVTQNDFTALPHGKELVLVSPAGHRSPLPISGDKINVGPLNHCGIWRIEEASSASASTQKATTDRPAPLLEIACNLANATESDSRAPVSTATDKQSSELVFRSFAVPPVWFWLILFALALTSMEWALYQRRTIS